MIRIGNDTNFKLLVNNFELTNNDTIIEGYNFFYDDKTKNLKHFAGFGKGYYGHFNEVFVTFNFLRKLVNINVSSYEGMTGFHFDEKTEVNNSADRETIDYVITLIKKLQKSGIIGKQLTV